VLTIDLEAISHRYLTERNYLPEQQRKEVVIEKGRKHLDGGSTLAWARGVLRLLKGRGQRATFFVVGEVHDWYPELIREIKESGHEIAYHSHTHTEIRSPELLREEIQKSRRFLEDFRPLGFRAPRAIMTERCLNELVQCGFAYDSSSYGPPGQYETIAGIAEIPISTYSLKRQSRLVLPRPLSLRLLTGLEVPFGSGYFISLFSLLDKSLTSRFISKCDGHGASAVLCLHPWQLFPRRIECFSGSTLSRLGFVPYDLCCFRAVEHLLENHRFYTMLELIEDLGIE
jgi:hypothetical protein